MEKIIKPCSQVVPAEGHIGYVKFEKPYGYIGLCYPQWGEVDLREVEIVG